MHNRNAQMIERIQSTRVQYPFRFTALGDSGAAVNPEGDLVFQGMLRQMKRLESRPVFLATVGDFAGPGDMGRHERYLKLLDEVGFDIPNICCIGNHECDDPSGVANFEAIHGPMNYTFDYANTRFVVINSVREFTGSPHVEGPNEDDMRFLDESFEGDDHTVHVVIMHLPPLFGDHYSAKIEWGFKVQEPEFLALMKTHRANLVICAHIVDYDYYEHDGTVYIVSGLGGWDTDNHPNRLEPTGPPFRGHFFHFVEFSVHENGTITGRLIKAGPGTQDEAAYRFEISPK